MKVYEKPALTLLTVSASDALCSGCDNKTRNTTDPFLIILNQKYGGSDGILDPGDLAFSSGESCTVIAEGFEAYCKFTGANQLFTS